MGNQNPGFELNRSSVSDRSDHSESASAIIVTIEGLGTNLVGCYGSSVCPTPNWDRMAAYGIVADQFWMDSCDSHSLLESLWSGTHHAHRCSNGHNFSDRNRSIQSPGLVVTDDPDAVPMARQHLEGEVVLVEPPSDESFAFGHLLSRAISEWLPRINTHPWLWIHSRGLSGPWDAPYEYRLTMCDEGDPNPPESIEPPIAMLDPSTDPDILFGWVCGAGGQAIAMDEAWEWIDSMTRELGIESQCLLILAGVQGYPLGEHYRVGLRSSYEQVAAPKFPNGEGAYTDEGVAFAERLHAPLILRPGTNLPLGLRFAQFLQPHHLASLIDAWIENDGLMRHDSQFPHSEPQSAACQLLCVDDLIAGSSSSRGQWQAAFRSALAQCGSEIALSLPSWSARWSRNKLDAGNGDPDCPSSDAGELYVLPEDRWQQNEVGSRAPEVLEAMSTIRDLWLRSHQDQGWELCQHLQKLDSSLWKPVR